ncbi:MAG: hypothetical protein OEV08_05600 [Nitrospira sp.]|nr:hypothetical protein [Nitrospira sp.]
MPDNVHEKKSHPAAKPASALPRKAVDRDLTCSEAQMEDLFAEGESSKPVSKSAKGLHPKRQPKSSH